MPPNTPNPTRIELHQKQRILDVGFDDGSEFCLPCEYLRVYSPSEEAKIAREDGEPITGKETVGITSIEQIGNYAVRIVFDDGHRTGIYSWENLYQLGSGQAQNWQDYLDMLAATGNTHDEVARGVVVRLSYAASLAAAIDRERESLRLVAGELTVGDLLAHLRERGAPWQELMRAEALKATVNAASVDADTLLTDGCEVGLSPGGS